MYALSVRLDEVGSQRSGEVFRVLLDELAVDKEALLLRTTADDNLCDRALE